MASIYVPDKSVLNNDRHVKYLLRCLKTYLPTDYTPNDSNRMLLACFTLSALDLLGVLHEHTTPTERAEFVNWIYHCQHPHGGFRGFTGTMVGKEGGTANCVWDPANLPSTVFALTALAILGDDMERVKRNECLEWIARLQWEDGSFGEVLGVGGSIEGKRDVRFCFLAAVVRRILRGKEGDREEGVKDINVQKLAQFVISSKTYDGGFAKAPYHEAHAGFTYCGIGALSMLGKLPSIEDSGAVQETSDTLNKDSVQEVIRWLVFRQTSFSQEQEEEEEEEEYLVSQDATPHSDHHNPMSQSPHDPATSHDPNQPPSEFETNDLPIDELQIPPEELLWQGLNGRCNKVADTCYSFWAGGTLDMFGKTHLLDFNANRRYLLDKTQHSFGGFGKIPGDRPDILHSYLGLAALAIMKEPGLRRLDPTLCISVQASEHLEAAMRRHRGRVNQDERGKMGNSSWAEGNGAGERHSHMAMSGG